MPARRVRHVLASPARGQRVGGRAGSRVRGVQVELGRQLADPVGQHVLLHVALGAEALVAQDALEGALLCVAPIVDLERAVAGERLEAELAGCVWSAREARLVAERVGRVAGHGVCLERIERWRLVLVILLLLSRRLRLSGAREVALLKGARCQRARKQRGCADWWVMLLLLRRLALVLGRRRAAALAEQRRRQAD